MTVFLQIFPLLISVLAPATFFWLIPRIWSRRQLTMDMFKLFSSNDMESARRTAWGFFRDAAPEQLADYIRYLIAQKHAFPRDDQHMLYHQISKVMEFFAILERLVENHDVQRRMTAVFFSHYYAWWREMGLLPLKRALELVARKEGFVDPAKMPSWNDDFPCMDALIEKTRKSRARKLKYVRPMP